MTIYDIPSLITQAHIRAFSAANIISAFEKSGIFPPNRHIFSEEDFCPSLVTDRPHVTGEKSSGKF